MYTKLCSSIADTFDLAGRLILIASLVFLSACKEELELHTQLSESDANEVLAALVENGISARKTNTKDGVTVYIQENDIAGAVRILNDRGLPRKNKTSMGEVFQKEGIISSPLEERARYIYALSQELEYTFSQIAGVIVARVHVVLPEKVAPGEPIQPSSAAVFIKHQDSLDPDVALPKIKRMVASSIPGLSDASSENIAVVFMPSDPNFKPLQNDIMRSMNNQALAESNSAPDGQPNYGLNIGIAGVALLCLVLLTLLKNTFNWKVLLGKTHPNANTKERGNSGDRGDT